MTDSRPSGEPNPDLASSAAHDADRGAAAHDVPDESHAPDAASASVEAIPNDAAKHGDCADVPGTDIVLPPLAENPYARVLMTAVGPNGVQLSSTDAAGAGAEPPKERPRIWPALLVGVLAMPIAGVVSTLLLLGAARIMHGELPRDRAALKPILEEFSTTRPGILLMVVPGQLVFLSLALGAAYCSPRRWTERLHLGWGRLPQWRWSWPVLVVGTPAVGFITAMVLFRLVDAKSENLETMQAIFQNQQGPFVLVLYLIVAVLPGIAEELVFRGYVQTRLLERFPPWLAIGATAAMFALAHFEPLHAVSVFPLGVWLGILAWRTGSIWPSILAHAFNNALATVMVRWGEVDVNNHADLARRGAVIMGCGYALLFSIVLLSAMRTPKTRVRHV